MAEKKGQDNKAKVKELTDKLEKGIQELFISDKYRSYLSVMNRFHYYSYNNSLLIHMQHPEATYVAGYKTWETLGRTVKKGEKRIYILAPHKQKAVRYEDITNPDTGEIKTDDKGRPQKERREIQYTTFRPVAIFDIGQTEGDPLPTLAEELKGKVPDYRTYMEAIKGLTTACIRFADWEGDKKGFYSPVRNEICIKSGMSELQTIKTAVHETAHSLLHGDSMGKKDSGTMEVEAESVAYILCQHLGLDTSEYSFGYIAGWSSDKQLPELKSSLSLIQKTSHRLIGQLESRLHKNTSNLDISLSEEQPSQKIPAISDIRHHRR